MALRDPISGFWAPIERSKATTRPHPPLPAAPWGYVPDPISKNGKEKNKKTKRFLCLSLTQALPSNGKAQGWSVVQKIAVDIRRIAIARLFQ
jgi:hypothetical protein